MQRSRIALFVLSALVGSVALTGCDQATEQSQASAPKAVPVGVLTLKSQALTLKKNFLVVSAHFKLLKFAHK